MGSVSARWMLNTKRVATGADQSSCLADSWSRGGERAVSAAATITSRKLHEDVAFRVLAGDNFSAHRTLREFHALHLNEFTELFTQVVRLACEMGLVKLGAIAVDGTKIKTNASRHKAMR